jgi:hypothetical protein
MMYLRSLFHGVGGGGRNLIPDKENPPQDILDWVATFSRFVSLYLDNGIRHRLRMCQSPVPVCGVAIPVPLDTGTGT